VVVPSVATWRMVSRSLRGQHDGLLVGAEVVDAHVATLVLLSVLASIHR
jgi:hypothetical protein